MLNPQTVKVPMNLKASKPPGFENIQGLGFSVEGFRVYVGGPGLAIRGLGFRG